MDSPGQPGRPSSYSPEYVIKAEKLARQGATDVEMADYFEVSVRTLYRWKNDYPEFSQALKTAKVEADARVEASLYQRALGFEQDTVKIFLDKMGEPVYAPYREKVAPDTTACIFWLKNRQPKQWRDKIDLEHSGGVTLKNSIPDPDYSQRQD